MPPSLKALKSFFAQKPKAAFKLPATKVRSPSLGAGDSSLKQSLREGKTLAAHPLAWKSQVGAPKPAKAGPTAPRIGSVQKGAPYTASQKREDARLVKETQRDVAAKLKDEGRAMSEDRRKIGTYAEVRKYELEQAQQASKVGMHDRAARIFKKHGVQYDDPRKRSATWKREDQKEMDLAYAARVRAETARRRLNETRAKLNTIDDIDELDRQIRHISGELKLGVQGSLRKEGEVFVWDHSAPDSMHHEIWKLEITDLKKPKAAIKSALAPYASKPAPTPAAIKSVIDQGTPTKTAKPPKAKPETNAPIASNDADAPREVPGRKVPTVMMKVDKIKVGDWVQAPGDGRSGAKWGRVDHIERDGGTITFLSKDWASESAKKYGSGHGIYIARPGESVKKK